MSDADIDSIKGTCARLHDLILASGPPCARRRRHEGRLGPMSTLHNAPPNSRPDRFLAARFLITTAGGGLAFSFLTACGAKDATG